MINYVERGFATSFKCFRAMRLLVKTGNECTGAVATGSLTHDAYQKALDQLLRDLRVEKA